MSNAHRESSSDGAWLDRLNDPERRVLALLALGHTVKSIAETTGWTEAAVNERLRAARRKTGVGSSRELARRFAQENRDEYVGLGGERVDALSMEPEDRASPRPRRKGFLIMAMFATAAALSAAIMLGVQAPSAAPKDPILGDLLGQSETRSTFDRIDQRGADFQEILAGEGSRQLYRQLHSAVRSERRDADWAKTTEARLQAAYDRSLRNSTHEQLRILCGSLICEVVVTADPDHPKAGTAMNEDLQSVRLNQDTEAAGLKNLTKMFTSLPSKRLLYLSYYKRLEAPTAAQSSSSS